MTGRAEFNEVFFTDVRVPQSNVVGAARRRLEDRQHDAEARAQHAGVVGHARVGVRAARRADEERDAGRPPRDRRPGAARSPRCDSRRASSRRSTHSLRMLTCALKKESPARLGTAEGSAALITKLSGCELSHQIAALAIDAMGEFGVLYDGSKHERAFGLWQFQYMFSLGLIIGGGTAQIQKNIIAERGLGMPREPKPRERAAEATALMDFGLTDEQKLLDLDAAAPARRGGAAAARARDHERRRRRTTRSCGRSSPSWASAGILVPEPHGGGGLALLDAALAMQSLGHGGDARAVPGDQRDRAGGARGRNARAAARVVAADRGRGRACSASRRAKLVVRARRRRRARRERSRCTARRSSRSTPGAADAFLVAVDRDRIALVPRDARGPRRRRRSRRSIARGASPSCVFEGVAPAEWIGGRDGVPGIADRVLAAGRIALAADILGACERAVEMAVAYAKQREQFGRPIATFQAVKHLCAEMVAELEPARSLRVVRGLRVRRATRRRRRCWRSTPRRTLAEVGTVIVRTATEVHGGIGFTDAVRPAPLVQARRPRPPAPRHPRTPPRRSRPPPVVRAGRASGCFRVRLSQCA